MPKCTAAEIVTEIENLKVPGTLTINLSGIPGEFKHKFELNKEGIDILLKALGENKQLKKKLCLLQTP
jgi:hypothetical protein